MSEQIPNTTIQETTQSSVFLDDFRCGYLIAVDKEGKFDFRIFGKETGAIELLGLHEIASIRLHEPFEKDKLARLHTLLEKVLHTFNELITPIPDAEEVTE